MNQTIPAQKANMPFTVLDRIVTISIMMILVVMGVEQKWNLMNPLTEVLYSIGLTIYMAVLAAYKYREQLRKYKGELDFVTAGALMFVVVMMTKGLFAIVLS